MAEDPRKVGVYDTGTSGNARTGGVGHMNWWIIALVVLLILVVLYFVL